jgi:hypothetical protein
VPDLAARGGPLLGRAGGDLQRQGGLAEAGISKGAAYVHRNRWPAFAARWNAAVEAGYAGIETGLLEQAGNSFSAPGPPPPGPLPPMSVDQALHLLHMPKHKVAGLGGRPGRAERLPKMEDVRRSIARTIEAVDRARGRSDADKARQRREWELRRRRRYGNSKKSGEAPLRGDGRSRDGNQLP